MAPTSTLGEFLRARRPQLRPADLGLPSHGRPGVPGLRRAPGAAALALLDH